MEWLRWIITVLAIAVAAFVGRDYGRTQMLAEMQAQAIQERDEANAELRDQVDSGKERASEAVADLVAVQASIKTIEQRTGSIGAQLKGALSASNLATCVLPDDVQRLRADAYQQAAAAAAAANQARGGH
jgi:hypothetical protein